MTFRAFPGVEDDATVSLTSCGEGRGARTGGASVERGNKDVEVGGIGCPAMMGFADRVWKAQIVYAHLVAGWLWCIVGLWWLTKILQRWKKTGPDGFQASPFYCAWKRDIPVEPIFKIFVGIVYASVEYHTAFENGVLVSPKHYHHVAAFLIVAVSGFADLAVSRKIVYPESISNFFMACFLVSYWWIMEKHNDNSMSEGVFAVAMHIGTGEDLLLMAMTIIVEVLHPQSLTIALLRPIIALHQAALFWTMTCTLYAPCINWDERHIPIYYGCYVGWFVVVTTLVLGAVIWVNRTLRYAQWKDAGLGRAVELGDSEGEVGGIASLTMKAFADRGWNVDIVYAHFVAGSLWIVLSLWWLVKSLQRWKKTGPDGFHGSSFYCAGKREVPVESIFKIFVGIVYASVEYHTAFENGVLVAPKHYHHVAAFSLLAVSGFADLALRRKIVFPESISNFFMACFLVSYWWIMEKHNDNSMSEGVFAVAMHIGTGEDLLMMAMTIIVEALHPQSLTIALLRPIIGFHQAALFWTMTCTLYAPCINWDERHIPIYYGCYVGWFVVVTTLVLGAVIWVNRTLRYALSLSEKIRTSHVNACSAAKSDYDYPEMKLAGPATTTNV
ncbi:unnamed protein product [Darwinula stevensoni]|uniref:Uncharacterized protein n=1 Tax=Darwinula stevensoni TaxID=69355 RepID=A0A7R9A5L8_9CRUS|nr:unnamed protein product [Darwinula stevensoni]CAG0886752.1 unnamed protein product [Darwinula stevensoni]